MRIAKGSVSATEMAKLGKCDLLISETPERLFGRQGEGNKQEKARGDKLHAKYEKEAKTYLSSPARDVRTEKKNTNGGYIVVAIVALLIIYFLIG